MIVLRGVVTQQHVTGYGRISRVHRGRIPGRDNAARKVHRAIDAREAQTQGRSLEVTVGADLAIQELKALKRAVGGPDAAIHRAIVQAQRQIDPQVIQVQPAEDREFLQDQAARVWLVAEWCLEPAGQDESYSRRPDHSLSAGGIS